MGVRPEDAIGKVIDRQSVRPSDVVFPGQNSSEVAAVHTHFTNISLELKTKNYK